MFASKVRSSPLDLWGGLAWKENKESVFSNSTFNIQHSTFPAIAKVNGEQNGESNGEEEERVAVSGLVIEGLYLVVNGDGSHPGFARNVPAYHQYQAKFANGVGKGEYDARAGNWKNMPTWCKA